MAISFEYIITTSCRLHLQVQQRSNPMRLSQVLVVAAASFLFASEAIAVTMDSNQAKISTVARGGPSKRLLRSYSKPVEDDSDDLDDSEERTGNGLAALATRWGYTVDDITAGIVKLNEKQLKKWQAVLNENIKQRKSEKIKEFNDAWRARHNIGRRV
ncbi:hypothetical protein Pcac1_g22657 [Phytophthora cactorum]|uniref:RxLR effector protein n=1 Tax=Phytophthora cactorum TaxID=29920 RepID=A0A8T1AI35_9STRA|nr:hypothetical protein Pcac1_g22657 [Phytophthora cactorum]KAG2800235.1 hypothetical protein PC112_g20571 [Phytophthora cactorum]KAG2800549.1 hypothetical protein PC111_g19925 [Phytophthora cactorum]KAG2883119.1 hypothetical protein PC115_g21726 [Phytophthora cactorum]KAG2912517.1 hypothetical protein PC114_g8861 [Phytophthora cactorum]